MSLRLLRTVMMVVVPGVIPEMEVMLEMEEMAEILEMVEKVVMAD